MSPMFTNPTNQSHELNPYPWVAPFWHIPGVAKGSKPVLILKCVVVESNEGRTVKVPVLMNSKAIDTATELCWDKSTAKSVTEMRTSLKTQLFTAAAKRKKLA